ncbi:Microtubule-associated protein SPIRAL2-like [Glycine soja]|uniref:Microtubule-associated protein SPIRAL2-like n=1 Tax=Glycine soja TaxID=3848 RepID=A0A0B2S4A6_GLYSO|nr:Microtubule-associated protein SPIRAL2-like [Glycine soja]
MHHSLVKALFTEQDQNTQASVVLCLASTIDRLDLTRLSKLLSRFKKLLKRDDFKVKPVLLTLVESIVAAGGASDPAQLKSLIPCLVEALSSEDWATRKAAAETLVVGGCRRGEGFLIGV